MTIAEWIAAALGLGLLLSVLWLMGRSGPDRPRRSLPWRMAVALAAVPWIVIVYLAGFGSAPDVLAAPPLGGGTALRAEPLRRGLQLEGRWRQEGEGHLFTFELLPENGYQVLESSSSGQLLAKGHAALEGRTVALSLEGSPRHWDHGLLHGGRPAWTARLFLDRNSLAGTTSLPDATTRTSTGEPRRLEVRFVRER